MDETERRETLALKAVRKQLAEHAATIKAIDARIEANRQELDEIASERAAAEGERDAFVGRARLARWLRQAATG